MSCVGSNEHVPVCTWCCLPCCFPWYSPFLLVVAVLTSPYSPFLLLTCYLCFPSFPLHSSYLHALPLRLIFFSYIIPLSDASLLDLVFLFKVSAYFPPHCGRIGGGSSLVCALFSCSWESAFCLWYTPIIPYTYFGKIACIFATHLISVYLELNVHIHLRALGCHIGIDRLKFGFSSVQSLSHVPLFVTPWTTAHQTSLSITNFRSLPKLMSIESVMPSNHFILCRPLLLPPSIFPSFRVFSNESALHMRWPKHWSFSFNISPSVNTQDWSPLGWTGWISLQSKGLSRVFSNTTVQKHQFFSAQLSL